MVAPSVNSHPAVSSGAAAEEIVPTRSLPIDPLPVDWVLHPVRGEFVAAFSNRYQCSVGFRDSDRHIVISSSQNNAPLGELEIGAAVFAGLIDQWKAQYMEEQQNQTSDSSTVITSSPALATPVAAAAAVSAPAAETLVTVQAQAPTQVPTEPKLTVSADGSLKIADFRRSAAMTKALPAPIIRAPAASPKPLLFTESLADTDPVKVRNRDAATLQPQRLVQPNAAAEPAAVQDSQSAKMPQAPAEAAGPSTLDNGCQKLQGFAAERRLTIDPNLYANMRDHVIYRMKDAETKRGGQCTLDANSGVILIHGATETIVVDTFNSLKAWHDLKVVQLKSKQAPKASNKAAPSTSFPSFDATDNKADATKLQSTNASADVVVDETVRPAVLNTAPVSAKQTGTAMTGIIKLAATTSATTTLAGAPAPVVRKKSSLANLANAKPFVPGAPYSSTSADSTVPAPAPFKVPVASDKPDQSSAAFKVSVATDKPDQSGATPKVSVANKTAEKARATAPTVESVSDPELSITTPGFKHHAAARADSPVKTNLAKIATPTTSPPRRRLVVADPASRVVLIPAKCQYLPAPIAANLFQGVQGVCARGGSGITALDNSRWLVTAYTEDAVEAAISHLDEFVETWIRYRVSSPHAIGVGPMSGEPAAAAAAAGGYHVDAGMQGSHSPFPGYGGMAYEQQVQFPPQHQYPAAYNMPQKPVPQQQRQQQQKFGGVGAGLYAGWQPPFVPKQQPY
ncbi:hypothetical protein BDZ88DRAFT_41960 [Geranomyces variabilis]|nr:hypothetical protein BDZ88DRAFT_41960 [Geranomyces variabilis]KAJ3137956.1 hypothetical protein HDU90_001431 [Geranomyces variabilis]